MRIISILFIGLMFCRTASALECVNVQAVDGVNAVLILDDYADIGNKVYLKKEVRTETGKPSIGEFSTALPQMLTIYNDGKSIKIHYDGTIELPEGMSLPEASMAFWKGISTAFPVFKEKIIGDYLKEKEGKDDR